MKSKIRCAERNPTYILPETEFFSSKLGFYNFTQEVYYPQVRKCARSHTVGGKSFSRLILRQGCLSHSGDALAIHSIIIPQDVGNSKPDKGG